MVYSVTIRSSPTGATILLGGVNFGTTPKTLTGLDGNYSMVLRKPGYEDYTAKTLTPLDAGKILTFTLTPIAPPEVPPEVPEFPKDVSRGPYTIRVDNFFQEEQAKEFLGIEPPGDDLDTWLSKRDLTGLEQWRDYWTDIFSKVGMAFWIDFVNDKFEEYKAKLPVPPVPPVPPELTWWEKLLEFLTIPWQIEWLKEKALFAGAYKIFTGKDLTEEEYVRTKAEILDWILPINLVSKLISGKNLKGEPEEFGSAMDWLEAATLLAVAVIPGPADDLAVRMAGKSISKTEAAKLVEQLGKKGIVDDLIRRVKLNPETSAKFLAAFPVEVRNAVINGLGRTAYGREVIYVLGKNNYFKYAAPGLKGFLAKVGTGPKWFITITGMLAGYVTFANFLAWVGKEALVETLSFPIWALIETKDWAGVLAHVDALRSSIKLADAAMLLTRPIPLISEIWKGFIDNANTQADIYEDIATKGLEAVGITGTLIVKPTPLDADVSVDKLPFVDKAFEQEVPIGIYRITVSRWEYISQTKDMEVKESAVTTWAPTLEKEEELPPMVSRLIISVEPADAVIKVADHPEINAPGTFEVASGSYTIDFSKEGYEDHRRTIYLDEGETEVVSVTLKETPPVVPPEEIKGPITITAIPDDVVIEIAGEPDIVEPGTYELLTGSYTIKASKEGFVSQSKTALVLEDKHAVVSFILEEVEPPEELPTPATIQIISEPTNSDIYIDGKYTFTQTPFTTVLEAGTYIIRVQTDGYYPQEATVTFGEGDEITVPFILTEIPEEVAPTITYTPYEPWLPEYEPVTYYTPAVSPTPYSQVSLPDYSLIAAPTFTPIIEPVFPGVTEKEIMINIETTDVKPWLGKIFSIAWKDLTTPGAETQVIVDEDEKGILEAFMNEFNIGNYKTIIGYNLKFDYQWIFNKLMLYRIPANKFYETDMRDVYQLMSQIKEEFVYNARAYGALDDYAKELLGIGKMGTQETLLRRYTAGDLAYVEAFQVRQIEITNGLYQLFRFSSSESFSAPVLSSPRLPAGVETPISPATPIQTGQKQCANCLAFNPITATQCEVCAGVIFN